MTKPLKFNKPNGPVKSVIPQKSENDRVRDLLLMSNPNQDFVDLMFQHWQNVQNARKQLGFDNETKSQYFDPTKEN